LELSKKRGDKKYYRYVINIPSAILKKANFKAGSELKAVVKNEEIKLSKK